MLWRAALSDVASERQHFISLAQHCHTLRVRFPNTLDEVQMLQKLDDSAFACYLLGCFWYSKRRYDEAVACWHETLEEARIMRQRIVCLACTPGTNNMIRCRQWLDSASSRART
jgi:hypothetical protein